MSRSERGSVLMEFVIVLPIYMLLLGFAFVTGELALQAIHLSGGADRTYAMTGSLTLFKEAVSPHNAYNDSEWKGTGWKADDEIAYDYDGDTYGGTHNASKYEGSDGETDGGKMSVVADPAFNGSWTKTVAAYVQNAYTLTPVTRSAVSFWRWDIEEKIKDMGYEGSLEKETALKKILDGGIGRAAITGKDMHKRDDESSIARQYGYYTLQRNEKGRYDDDEYEGKKLRYRAWDAGSLAQGDVWKVAVSDGISPADYVTLDGKSRSDEGNDPPAHSDSDAVSLPEKEFPDSWTR